MLLKEPPFGTDPLNLPSPKADVQNGDDCFVRLTNPHETTFKRVFSAPDGKMRLQPRNDLHAPIMINGSRINGLYRAVIHYQKL